MSHNENNDQSRRRFIKLAAGTAVAGAAFSLMPRYARAAGLPHLKPSDPTAHALQYTEDASKTSNPKHKKGANCSNCTFYQGKPGAAYGPCQLFPGKAVNAKGWCISHQPKSG